ncbi:unnamed protein product, partial [Laminaria digitata]
MPADPRIEATCTLGGIVGMVTGSGTPIAAGGGAEVGLKCNTVGSPCQGSPGGSCSNPSWSCGPTTGSTTDA